MAADGATLNNDRMKEVKEFDESKIGVKGLADSGITSIPKFFIHSPETLSDLKSSQTHTNIPVIDLANINSNEHHPKIINQIKEAAKTWGFFQVINHGIPISVINETIQAIKTFHEQLHEIKAKYYKRDEVHGVMYASNNDLYRAKAASWHDSLQIWMNPNPAKVKHGEEWVDVKPLDGALTINVGDFLQVISNDEYKSVQHRVLANSCKEPRISVVIFFSVGKWKESGFYGPLPELLSPEKPALYREFTLAEFLENFYSKELDSKSLIEKIKL